MGFYVYRWYYDQLEGEQMLSLGMDLFMTHLSKVVNSSDDNEVILKEEYDNWRVTYHL